MIAEYDRATSADALAQTQSLLFHVLNQVDLRRERVMQDMVRPYNLTVSQSRALIYLGLRSNGAAMTELAQILVIDRTSLTRTMDKLVAAGLVERCEAEHDRRVTRIALTEEGERVRRTLTTEMSDHSHRLLEGLPDADIDGANRVLTAILERLVGHEAGAQRLMELL